MKRIILLFSILLFCLVSKAQDRSGSHENMGSDARREGGFVTGFLKDATTGHTIVGARVTYKEIAAAITDSTGKFVMKVPDYRISIRIEADGYQSKEIPLKGRKSVPASLHEEGFESFYDDAAFTFGLHPKSQSTFSITSVKTNGNWNNIPETPDDYLQGKVPGLNAIRRSGTPGSGANLFLRGFSSLYATNQPLIIVDGVFYDISNYGNSLIPGYYQNPLSFIDVKDIESMTVLKDGASIYGTKGANGVILITTSRARKEATSIDVALYGGVNLSPENMPVMNIKDYRIYLSDMLQSKGLSAKQMQVLPYMNDDMNNPDYYRNHYNTDWQNKVFANSYVQNGYLKITGGDNIAKYALTIGFLKNEGIIKNTGETRYNTRFNADLNLSKRLTAIANLSFAYTENQLKNTGPDLTTNPIYTALVKSPFLPARNVDDNGIESPALADKDTFNISNPVAIIQNMQALNKSYRFTGSVKLNYQLTDHLSIMSDIAVTMDKVRESFFVPQVGIVSDTLYNAIAKNRSGAQVIRMFSFYNDTRLSYSRVFNNIHQFAVRLGTHYIHTNTERDNGLGFNSATDQLTEVSYGLNSLRRIGGSLGEWKWMNVYFSTDYDFLNKYFLSFNMSVDGSSRFGEDAKGGSVFHAGNHNYALMPSLSGAWLVSSEEFMKSNTWIDLLKLRASVGISGNDDIGNYTARKFYVSQNLLGVEGLVRGNSGNPELQWESVTRLNGGLDVSLMNERLSMSLDVYRKMTADMIVYEPAPAASGFDYTISNSGGMKTTGWEIGMNWRAVDHKDMKLDLGFNISHYKSRITKLPVDNILTDFADATIITATGGAPNLFYGYEANGIYTSDQEAAAEGLSNRNIDGSSAPFMGGDVRFKNVNNGDNIIDESDRQVIGDPNPDITGAFSAGLTWKRWTLDGLATFSQGNDLYNYTRRQLESMSGFSNQTKAIINRWRTAGQATDIPRASWGDPLGNSRFSSRWIEDGSYLRLKSLSLSYRLPVHSGALKYAIVYVTGNNLLTLTDYLGYDPEFDATASVFGQGVDMMMQPQYKTLQLGVKIGL